jgi:hypothetical protein
VDVSDFNGDGNLDLLGSAGIELPGNGDGTFGNAVNTGVYGSAVVGDFNLDGKMDIALPSFNSVSVYLGNGDGTFKSSGDFSTGYDPISVVVGDFNGDGKADLIVLNNNGSSVSVLLGNGDGTFPNPPLYPIDADAGQMVSGDFNGDGIADMAVANPNEQTVSILLANGDGTFQPKVDSATGATGLPGFMAVGDFNRDGHADIAISTDGVNVLLGKGNGSFQPPVSYAVLLPLTSTPPGAVAVGDFNGDGFPDLVVANGSLNPTIDGWVSILLGNGDGTFRAHVEYPTGGFPGIVAVGDLNGDGKADLVVTINSAGGSVNVLLGNGNGTFQAPVAYAAGLLYPSGLAIGDFNGDGKPDLVVDHADSVFFGSSVSVLIGNGDGSFQAPVEYATGGTPTLAGIGDFNGDGILDLAVNARAISLDILLGNGDGTFQPYAEYGKGEVWSSATIADFNGDGALDVGFILPFGPASVILNLRGTALNLQSSQSSVLLGQSVTFTATIHPGLSAVSLPAPTGTVKVMDGTTQLSAQTLGADGVVTFSTSTLTSGTHNISAVYSGDSNFNPHTVSLVQVVNGPNFAINTTPASGTLNSGNSATFSVAVSPMYGFNGSVSLTCSVSPTPALAPTCSLSPTSVAVPASGSATANLTVSTTAAMTSLVDPPFRNGWRPLYALWLPIFGLTLMGAGLGRGQIGRKKIIVSVVFTGLLLIALGPQSACGSGGSTSHVGSSGTPSGKYTVTVNAASGPTTHTTSVTLTVQ